MVSVMLRSENNLLKVSESNGDSENELLQARIAELQRENELLTQRLQAVASSSQLTHEREAISLYLELVANKISGIPSITKIIREVLLDLAAKIRNGEHFKLKKESVWR